MQSTKKIVQRNFIYALKGIFPIKFPIEYDKSTTKKRKQIALLNVTNESHLPNNSRSSVL